MSRAAVIGAGLLLLAVIGLATASWWLPEAIRLSQYLEPRPDAVPRDAERKTSLKDGGSWEWRENVESTCVHWRYVSPERFALILAPRSECERESIVGPGAGIEFYFPLSGGSGVDIYAPLGRVGDCAAPTPEDLLAAGAALRLMKPASGLVDASDVGDFASAADFLDGMRERGFEWDRANIGLGGKGDWAGCGRIRLSS